MRREEIIDTAEKLARREGLEAVTVRRVAADLGVTAAALYWHVEDKQAIVQALVDRASRRTEHPGPECGNWIQRLVRFYVSTREQFTAYAGLSAALASAEPSDATLANCLYVIDLLVEAGFDQPTALSVFDSMSTLSFGHLMMIDVGRFNRSQARGDAIAAYADRVRSVIEQKPEYAALVREFDDARSLTQLVNGIELIARASALEAGIDAPSTKGVAFAT